MTTEANARRDTPLARKLREQIRRHGPMTVSDYMRACLQDGEHGYYRTRPAIGGAGISSPRRKSARCSASCLVYGPPSSGKKWEAPEPINLVELGPGRGTLMQDALRAARVTPEFRAAIHVHLIESSKVLALAQRTRLAEEPLPIAWHRTLADVPKAATILMGNEFLDTMPVSQFVSDGAQWRQRGIGLDANDRLSFLDLALNEECRELAAQWSPEPAGDIRELQDYGPLIACLLERAREAPLAALFVDYGHNDGGPGETLQAVRAHCFEHPLTSPGEADLTVHVDFAELVRQALAMAEAAKVAIALDGPVTQAALLGTLGVGGAGLAADGVESGQGQRDRDWRGPAAGSQRHGHPVQGDRDEERQDAATAWACGDGQGPAIGISEGLCSSRSPPIVCRICPASGMGSSRARVASRMASMPRSIADTAHATIKPRWLRTAAAWP